MYPATSSSMSRRAAAASSCRALTFSSTTMPQVVDRVEVDVLEFADARIDVARYGEVEHEHRPVPALVERSPDLVEANHESRARGGGNDEVGLRQVRSERVEPDRGGLETLCDSLGTACAPVRDDHAPDFLGMQVPGAELDHFAGADQERRMSLESREHAARELNAGGGDGHRTCADRRFRANALGDGKARLEQAIELRSCRARAAAPPGRRP